MGAGQAIFFLNLDPTDPANQPPDSDGDGIRDLCDNCPSWPNGPLAGSCVGGLDHGSPCRSDGECAGDAFCSLSQEDDDFAPPGLACPEPALGLGVAIGTGWLAARSASRRRRRIASSGRSSDPSPGQSEA